MSKNFNSKKVVLAALLILPFLVYFIFVYNSEENFFVTLDYVGPEKVMNIEKNGTVITDTVPYQIPPYEFTTQHDTLLSSDELKGKIYVANFFFTSCPTICPAMNYHVKQVQDRFKGYENFRIVSFSVDPEYDTVEVLQQYAKDIGAIDGLWYFLTGERDQIYKTANQDFFLSAMEDSTAPGGYLHSENLVLVDWDGRIRSRRDDNGNLKAVYQGTSLDDINKLKDDIKVLIAEYEKKKSVDEYRASKEKEKNG